MNHCGTQTIETERLVLRKFRIEDARPMFENWATDAEVTKFLTWEPHANPGVTEAYIAGCAVQYALPEYYHWAITLKESETSPIGALFAGGIKEQAQIVHVGYCLGRQWWNQGIMTEAMTAVIGFFFDKVGANRVEARHDPRNVGSGRVMQKCGMQYEGMRRSAGWNNQGICDDCWYGILRSDYEEDKK